jgi:hypothetical protein
MFGNKIDMEAERECSLRSSPTRFDSFDLCLLCAYLHKGQELAGKWRCPFFKGSAKLGVNITESFHQIVCEIKRCYPNKAAGGAGGEGDKKGAEGDKDKKKKDDKPKGRRRCSIL